MTETDAAQGSDRVAAQTTTCDSFDCSSNYSPKQPLMREELFATWISTGYFICIVGNQLAARTGVADDLRANFDVLALCIGILIILWAAFSYYNLMRYPLHKLGEILIVVLSIAYLAYAAWETSQQNL